MEYKTVERLTNIQSWNSWRAEHPKELIDLSGANLKGANLKGANLEWANLKGANF